MGITIGNEKERVGTGDLLNLMQRTEANNQPITRRQLNTFMRNPGGTPPEQCVNLQLLPAKYSFSDDKYDTPKCISHLTVTPDNKSCTVGLVDGVTVITCGGKEFHYEIKTKEEDLTFLGFDKSGQPVITVTPKEVNYYCSGATALFFGDKKLEGQYINARLLSDGRVAFLRRRDENSVNTMSWIAIISPDGSMETFTEKRESGRAHSFTLSEYGLLYLDYFIPRGAERVANFLVKASTRTFFKVDTFQNSAHTDQIAETNGKLFFFSTSGYWGNFKKLKDDQSLESIEPSIKSVSVSEYKRGLTELPNGIMCYIAEAKDGLENWVINGIPQPTFDFVSPLFQEGNEWFYYAYIAGRRQLLTMAIPIL